MPTTLPKTQTLGYKNQQSVATRNTIAETQLSGALLKLSLEFPYLTAAFWAMHRIPTEEVETMAVDSRWRLYYNPDQVAYHWSVPETSAVLYHEVCHLLRDHAGRAPAEVNGDEHSAFLWNLAADAEINDDLIAEGQPLPGNPVLPATIECPDKLTAEEYYLHLQKTHCKAGDEPKTSETGVGEGNCGSCAHGHTEAFEKTANAAGIKGLPDGEAILIHRTVAQEIHQQMKKQGRGSIPGGWERWADKILKPPTVNWRQELAASVRRALAETSGRTNYRYSKPGRRQASLPDFVVPGLVQPVAKVAVAIDTSGSMGEEDLTQAVSETAGILKAQGLCDGVTVFTVDASVHACKRVFDPRQIRPLLKGGGGTDMGVALRASESLRPIPDIMVVITDGYTPWPESPPSGVDRVIILITSSNGNHACPPTPSWARTVRMTPDQG